LHAENPLVQLTVHDPLAQPEVALATDVVHAWPHEPQLVTSVIVFVQPPPQRDGVEDVQPEEHEYTPASSGAQRGAPPSGLQAVPHPPQLADVVYETQPPAQAENPPLQA
jgi:hypothetical protein